MRLFSGVRRKPDPLKDHIWILSLFICPHNMRVSKRFWRKFFCYAGRPLQLRKKHLHEAVSNGKELVINCILLDIILIHLSKLRRQRHLSVFFCVFPLCFIQISG